MNPPSAPSPPTRTGPVAAIAPLVGCMAVALLPWRISPRPHGWLAWVPVALLSAGAGGGPAVPGV